MLYTKRSTHAQERFGLRMGDCQFTQRGHFTQRFSILFTLHAQSGYLRTVRDFCMAALTE